MADEPVKLKGPVYGKLSNLVVTREDSTIKAEWKIPKYLSDENYAWRLTSVDAYVDFSCSPDNDKRQVEVWKETFDVSGRKSIYSTLNADHYFVRGLEKEGGWTSGANAGEDFDKPYDRNRYYPVTTKECHGVTVAVHGVNVYGSYDDTYQRGPNIYQTFKFEKPQQPVCEFTGWDEDNNYAASYTIDANPMDEDESKTNYERYDTRYRIMRQDNLPNSGYGQRKVLMNFVESSLEKIENSIAAPSGLRSLQDGQWIRLDLEAYSRGMAGQSLHSSASILAARPERAAITSVKASSLDMVYGVVTVSVKIPWDGYHWTTQAKLQRAKNVNPSWSAQKVAADGTWEDVSGMLEIDQEYGDATYTTGFCDSVASAYPNENKKTWYRVITENDLYFGDNASMGIPTEASVLFHAATAVGSTVFIESMETGEDATSIKMLLGWPNESPANTGTEVSWSEHADAWESSEQPTTAFVNWEDATSQGTHAHSASFTIYGVEPGKPYYIKARRYNIDENDDTTYGAYATGAASLYPYIPAQPPTDVRLSAPSYVPRGSDIPLTWTFQSDAPQTAWAVYSVEYTTSNGVTSESGRTAIASGEDPYGACTVPANMLSGDSVHLAVSLTTGSSWATSEVSEVVFADKPEIEVTFPSIADPDYTTDYPLLMEQPLVLYCSSDTGDDMLHVRISSRGVSSDYPDGERVQLDGDSVFDAWVYPTWLEDSGGTYRCSVTVPHIDLHDVGVYRWEVVARNTESGLESDAQTGEFKVRWAHQAHVSGDTTITVYADGRGVEVFPGTPDNVAEGDVFDLYRVTPDGVDLIAEGLAFGSKVMDRFAPFGERVYRVATRTVDGDVAWTEAEYTLDAKVMRFDFGHTSHIELPFNVVRSDSWSKDFERRQHLDGSRAGFWNEGASRDASLSTDLIRFSSDEDQEALRELATHAGPVFVRLPNGCAYQANVDVGGMDETYNSGAVAVSFNVQQVELTDAFKVAPSNVVPPETDEYDPVHYGRSEILYWSKTAPTAGSSFDLIDEPSGSVRVELTSSYDSYSDVWSITNTVSGDTVTLGTFSQQLAAYIAEAVSEECSFRLMARYDVEGE